MLIGMHEEDTAASLLTPSLVLEKVKFSLASESRSVGQIDAQSLLIDVLGLNSIYEIDWGKLISRLEKEFEIKFKKKHRNGLVPGAFADWINIPMHLMNHRGMFTILAREKVVDYFDGFGNLTAFKEEPTFECFCKLYTVQLIVDYVSLRLRTKAKKSVL